MTEEDGVDQGGDAPAPRPSGEASEKQLNFIRSLQRRIGLDDADLLKTVDEVAGVGALEELDRRQASEVIDELQVIAKDRGIDLDSQPLASEKQVGFMKQLKRRAHMTDDEFAAFLEERAGVSDAAEVGKRDASAIIDELLKLADGKGGAGPAGGATKAARPAGGGAKKAPARGRTGGSATGGDASGGGGAGGGRRLAEGSRPAAGAAGGKRPAARRDEDDDRPPERGPPPDLAEPGSFDDGPDDADLDRDPGPERDDDLPF